MSQQAAYSIHCPYIARFYFSYLRNFSNFSKINLSHKFTILLKFIFFWISLGIILFSELMQIVGGDCFAKNDHVSILYVFQ